MDPWNGIFLFLVPMPTAAVFFLFFFCHFWLVFALLALHFECAGLRAVVGQKAVVGRRERDRRESGLGGRFKTGARNKSKN